MDVVRPDESSGGLTLQRAKVWGQITRKVADELVGAVDDQSLAVHEMKSQLTVELLNDDDVGWIYFKRWHDGFS